MKKVFLMAAVAAATLTACSKSETIEQPRGRAIQFENTVVSRNATSLNSGQFNIFGSKAGTTSVFEADEVYDLTGDHYKRGSTGTADTWTGMYYYDGVSTYAFYGYAKTNQTTFVNVATLPTAFVPDPAGVTVVTTPGSEKISFEASNNNKVDLVTMSTTVLPAAHSSAQNKVVTFKHALTRIRFTAYSTTVDPMSPIKITSITFKTAKNAGDITGATDIAAGTMVASGSTAATFTLNTVANFPTLTATATAATTTNDVFYVVPQTLGNGDLEVTYSVDGGANITKSFNLATANAGDPIVMLSGQSYNFSICINLNQITFNAELEEWAEVTQPL